MRLEDAAEVTLAGLLPGSRLTQCSHSEELVEPAEEEADGAVRLGSRPPVLLCELGAGGGWCPHCRADSNAVTPRCPATTDRRLADRTHCSDQMQCSGDDTT